VKEDGLERGLLSEGVLGVLAAEGRQTKRYFGGEGSGPWDCVENVVTGRNQRTIEVLTECGGGGVEVF
jgi:hypothetical protein